jgi:hypothetical protein
MNLIGFLLDTTSNTHVETSMYGPRSVLSVETFRGLYTQRRPSHQHARFSISAQTAPELSPTKTYAVLPFSEGLQPVIHNVLTKTAEMYYLFFMVWESECFGSIVTAVQSGRFGVLIKAGKIIYFLVLYVQTGSGAYRAPHSKEQEIPPPPPPPTGAKQLGR